MSEDFTKYATNKGSADTLYDPTTARETAP